MLHDLCHLLKERVRIITARLVSFLDEVESPQYDYRLISLLQTINLLKEL